MPTISYIKYIGQYIPLLFLQNTKLATVDCSLLLPASGVYYMSLFFKNSFSFKKSVLIDMGGSDLPWRGVTEELAYKPISWYIFKDQLGNKLCAFSLAVAQVCSQSVEILFRNARWLEREATDFFGFFFANKSDRRSLFTLPLFYFAPFRRKYPAAGFYELFFCPLLKKLRFRHLSLQV